jgi:hypothetical protein
VSRRLPLYLLEFRRRTLLSSLSFKVSSMRWPTVAARRPRLETHLTLVLTVPLVETTSLK